MKIINFRILSGIKGNKIRIPENEKQHKQIWNKQYREDKKGNQDYEENEEIFDARIEIKEIIE